MTDTTPAPDADTIERADRLQKDVEEYDAILTRQSDLLTRTVNALRGNPPPLTSWSHHDIPKLAATAPASTSTTPRFSTPPSPQPGHPVPAGSVAYGGCGVGAGA